MMIYLDTANYVKQLFEKQISITRKNASKVFATELYLSYLNFKGN